MFQTSGDILNIIIAICVLIFTVFVVLAIYNFLSGLKKVRNLVSEVEKSVRKLLEIIDSVENKVQKSTSYVYMVSEVAKNIFDLVKKNKRGKGVDEDNSGTKKKRSRRPRKKD
jgi:hypothetical protein